MKHINITNWQGNITDWTKFNYIYGGLDETIADRVNLRIPGTNLRNYIKKDDNLYNIGSYSTTMNGVSISVSNQTLTLNGTSTKRTWDRRNDLSITLEPGTYTMQWFTSYTGNDIGFGIFKPDTDLANLYVLNEERYRTFTISESTTFYTMIWWSRSNMTFNNVKVSCMVYKGSYKAYTMFEPYGSMVLVENVGSNLQPLDPPKVTVFNQVDLGTLSWTARKIGSSTDCRMMASDLSSVIALSSSDAVPANISCPKYKTLSANNTYLKNTGISVDGSGSIAVYDENYNQSTSASAFKEAMNGVILIYEAKDTSNANTLSMASPMQLQNNVEDITDNMSVDELLEPANEER